MRQGSVAVPTVDGGTWVREYARMRRTTISLPDDLAAALEREARRRRVPVSQVAREAIEARLGLSDEAPRDVPFIGIGSSGHASISEDLDDLLAAEWTDAPTGHR